jgi:DNA invertase Pin-like site-specific DNA recombinase
MSSETAPAVTTNTIIGQLIGYARVSTDDQEAQLQRDALTAAGCARIFADRASGKNTDRPELRSALDYARAGDTLCVWKLDRFARSLIDLVTMVDTLRERGIGFKVLTGALANIDLGTADGRLMLQVVGAMAEFERSLIMERTRAGLDAAKAQGRTGGRPSAVNEDVLIAARARKAKGRERQRHSQGSGRLPGHPVPASRRRLLTGGT